MAKKPKTTTETGALRNKKGATPSSTTKNAASSHPTKLSSSSGGGLVTSFPLHLLSNDNWHGCNTRPQVLVQGRVVVLSNFFTVKECQAWITFCETLGRLEYTAHPASKYMAHRECYRMQQSDATELAQRIYQRLTSSSILPLVHQETATLYNRSSYASVGCNPNLRLYKYLPGHSFGKHVDGCDTVDTMGQTEWTVLIYLSECQGGATRFYTTSSFSSGRQQRKNSSSSSSNNNHHYNSVAYEPKVGSILLHLHGDHCLEHEGETVRGGIKYVLRTDLVFGIPSKNSC